MKKIKNMREKTIMSEPMSLDLAEQYLRYAAEHEADRAAARLLAEYDSRGAALGRVRDVAEGYRESGYRQPGELADDILAALREPYEFTGPPQHRDPVVRTFHVSTGEPPTSRP